MIHVTLTGRLSGPRLEEGAVPGGLAVTLRRRKGMCPGAAKAKAKVGMLRPCCRARPRPDTHLPSWSPEPLSTAPQRLPARPSTESTAHEARNHGGSAPRFSAPPHSRLPSFPPSACEEGLAGSWPSGTHSVPAIPLPPHPPSEVLSKFSFSLSFLG